MPESTSSVFDALYRKLLLRDVFGKMAPGALVLFALGWFVALALQSLGEKSGILCLWPQSMNNDVERYGVRIQFGRVATELHQAISLHGESA